MIQRPVLAEILKKRARLSKAKKVAGVKRKGAQAASYSPHVIFEKGLYRTGAEIAFFGLMRYQQF